MTKSVIPVARSLCVSLVASVGAALLAGCADTEPNKRQSNEGQSEDELVVSCSRSFKKLSELATGDVSFNDPEKRPFVLYEPLFVSMGTGLSLMVLGERVENRTVGAFSMESTRVLGLYGVHSLAAPRPGLSLPNPAAAHRSALRL